MAEEISAWEEASGKELRGRGGLRVNSWDGEHDCLHQWQPSGEARIGPVSFCAKWASRGSEEGRLCDWREPEETVVAVSWCQDMRGKDEELSPSGILQVSLLQSGVRKALGSHRWATRKGLGRQAWGNGEELVNCSSWIQLTQSVPHSRPSGVAGFVISDLQVGTVDCNHTLYFSDVLFTKSPVLNRCCWTSSMTIPKKKKKKPTNEIQIKNKAYPYELRCFHITMSCHPEIISSQMRKLRHRTHRD